MTRRHKPSSGACCRFHYYRLTCIAFLPIALHCSGVLYYIYNIIYISYNVPFNFILVHRWSCVFHPENLVLRFPVPRFQRPLTKQSAGLSALTQCSKTPPPAQSAEPASAPYRLPSDRRSQLPAVCIARPFILWVPVRQNCLNSNALFTWLCGDCDCDAVTATMFIFLRGCSQSQCRNRYGRGRPAVVLLCTVFFTYFG